MYSCFSQSSPESRFYRDPLGVLSHVGELQLHTLNGVLPHPERLVWLGQQSLLAGSCPDRPEHAWSCSRYSGSNT